MGLDSSFDKQLQRYNFGNCMCNRRQKEADSTSHPKYGTKI